MAIGLAALTSGTDVSAAGTSTTASITPTASRLVLIDVYTEFNSPANAANSAVSGSGLTWDLVTSTRDTTDGINIGRFRALSASPGTGALTITHPDAINFCAWSVHEHSGIDTSGTNGSGAIVQSASSVDISGSSASLTVTLAAFGSASNGAVSAFTSFNVAPVSTASPDSGWTEIHDLGNTISGGALGLTLETQFIASNDTTAAVTFSATGAMLGIATEIAAAAGGADTLWAQGVM